MAENPFMDLPEENPFLDLPDEKQLKSEQAIGQMKYMPTYFTAGPKDYAKIAGGLGETALNLAGTLGTKFVAGAAGIGSGIYEGAKALTGSESRGIPVDPNAPASTVRAIEGVGQKLFHPRTEGGQVATETVGAVAEKAGEAVKYPLSAVPFLIGGKGERQEFMERPMGDYLGSKAQDAGASPLWATAAHMGPDVLLSIFGVKGAGAAKGAVTKPIVPTVEQLKATASQYYKLVDDSGMVIKPAGFKSFVASARNKLTKKGSDPDLTPKTEVAMQRLIDEEVASGLTMQRAEILRRKLSNAVGAAGDDADRALARQLLDDFDQYMEGLTQASVTGGGVEAVQYVKSARALWTRARKTEAIEELIEKAMLNAESATGMSGLAHTLRIQFKQLANNKKRMRMFTPAEQLAIRRVAAGGAIEKVFRYLGKFDPVNPWNVLGDVGVGAAAGMWIGGPPGAAIGAITVPTAGRIGRFTSNRMTDANARRASELMRSE